MLRHSLTYNAKNGLLCNSIPFVGKPNDKIKSKFAKAKQASTLVLYTSLIFSLKSRDSTCLVVYLDVNSLLKARLALGLRFKMF